MAADHWLLNTSQINMIRDVYNRRKLSAYFPDIESALGPEEQVAFLTEAFESLEFEAIEVWNAGSSPQRETFVRTSRLCFEALCALPVPEKDSDKIERALRIVTYGYLGEKWEAARRYLIEHEESFLVNTESANWTERVLAKTYLAIVYIVRKNSWQDLSRAIDLIEQLRQEQKEYEATLLSETDEGHKEARALELASLYHFAKSIETVARFQSNGTPPDALHVVQFHFERAIHYCEAAGNHGLNFLLHTLQATFEKMLLNSVWMVAQKVNSRVSKFVDLITKSSNPIIELLYPQRHAILDGGLLDPAHKAIVLGLPTSSGKTVIAEFRMLQALNQFADEKGWVAYVAPTRALVNQICVRLRQDLGPKPLGMKIEKMSGALELDAYEDNLVTAKSDFDILVITPEKLSLLVRQGIQERIGRPLALVVVDEAHNIESAERGMNLEILLSVLTHDCPKANYLLLTPFLEGSDKIAKWLDPQSPKSIGVEIDWQPNDMVVGMFYAEGAKRHVKTVYKPLVTSKPTITVPEALSIGEDWNSSVPFSTVRDCKWQLASVVATQLPRKDSVLVVARTVDDTYQIAEDICKHLDSAKTSKEELDLVRRFVAAEMGDNFPLVGYLEKGVGIHSSGLPDEVRLLMEMLMEKRVIRYLVATSTIAQGINFPVSTILMASYSYPRTSSMPVRDFWNLAGRAGRVYQETPGVVGIAVRGGKNSPDALRVAKYVQDATEELVSVLVRMVNEATTTADKLDLASLYYKPSWSAFLQYVAHMYKQSKDLGTFVADLEMTMKRTYGYSQLSAEKRQVLLKSVGEYARSLDHRKHLATLSDMTGFSPEAIESTMAQVSKVKIAPSDWSSGSLFSSDAKVLQKLVGIMLSVPEIKSQLSEIVVDGQTVTHSTLARLITDWVRGEEIPSLAKKYFGGEDHKAISNCVSAIYRNLAYAAPWGLGALQIIPGSGLDQKKLSEDEKRRLRNLPAMVYYGVSTDEAVLLRKVNVPRTLSHRLGKVLSAHLEGKLFDASSNQVIQWLGDLSDGDWQKAAPSGKKIAGGEYKRIWRMLSGLESVA